MGSFDIQFEHAVATTSTSMHSSLLEHDCEEELILFIKSGYASDILVQQPYFYRKAWCGPGVNDIMSISRHVQRDWDGIVLHSCHRAQERSYKQPCHRKPSMPTSMTARKYSFYEPFQEKCRHAEGGWAPGMWAPSYVYRVSQSVHATTQCPNALSMPTQAETPRLPERQRSLHLA